MEDEPKYAKDTEPTMPIGSTEVEKKGRSEGVIEKIALILSTIFSPLLVPTYACAISLWTTPLSAFPEWSRFKLSMVIFLITAIVPLAVIIFLIRIGKVSDAAISNRRQRGIPYLLTGVCYFVACLYLRRLGLPAWLFSFFMGACFCTMAAIVINVRWKISAHSMTMGGLCALLIYIAVNNEAVVSILPWIIGAVICAGAVGSSRIFLKRHTPAQVYVGWLFGLIVEYLFMII